MKKNINKTESLDEQCIICGSWSNLIISAKIREKTNPRKPNPDKIFIPKGVFTMLIQIGPSL